MVVVVWVGRGRGKRKRGGEKKEAVVGERTMGVSEIERE